MVRKEEERRDSEESKFRGKTEERSVRDGSEFRVQCYATCFPSIQHHATLTTSTTQNALNACKNIVPGQVSALTTSKATSSSSTGPWQMKTWEISEDDHINERYNILGCCEDHRALLSATKSTSFGSSLTVVDTMTVSGKSVTPA